MKREYISTINTSDFKMNEMAKDGWELVTVVMNPVSGTKSFYWVKETYPDLKPLKTAQISRCCI